MESDFGICSYIHESDQKVPCVLKQMYSDFIVQEVAGIVYFQKLPFPKYFVILPSSSCVAILSEQQNCIGKG